MFLKDWQPLKSHICVKVTLKPLCSRVKHDSSQKLLKQTLMHPQINPPEED